MKKLFAKAWNRTIGRLLNRYGDYYFWEITDEGKVIRI